MRIAKFRKTPGDRKRYEVNYEDWLNEDETVVAVTIEGNNVEDDFYVDAYVLHTDGKEVIFYVSGGIPGNTYVVTIIASTSLTQVKEDTVEFYVT